MAFALDRVVGERVRIGFDFINTMDMSTGRFTPRGYAYRKTNTAPPLMLAMCPWCGVKTKALWPVDPPRTPSTKGDGR
jgi:hypothetical protein